MKATKANVTLSAIAVGYIAALSIGQHMDSFSGSGTSILVLNDANARCQMENVYVGDGLVRGRHTCAPVESTEQGK